MNKLNNQIKNLENKLNITFPKSYFIFLSNIPEGEVYNIQKLGIVFYSYLDLEERNNTYEIHEYEPDFFMIGQDGDLGYFINAKNSDDETIYFNDLGSIGSLSMEKKANDIQQFINNENLF